MEKTMQIITNNPKVYKNYKDDYNYEISYVDGGYLDVLLKIRDEVHSGSILLSHPLYGSVKPNETPFRTVIIEKKRSAVDFESLKLIDNSLNISNNFINVGLRYDVCDKMLMNDFAEVDFSLIKSTLDKK